MASEKQITVGGVPVTNAGLTNTSRYQLGILRSKVEYDDSLVMITGEQ